MGNLCICFLKGQEINTLHVSFKAESTLFGETWAVLTCTSSVFIFVPLSSPSP